MKETNFTKLTCWCMVAFFGLFGAQMALAQCPVGQTNVEVTTMSGTFDAENGWELVDATTNTVLLCESSGPGIVAPGTFSTCVVDGNSIELHTYDDFGDTWNGAMIAVSSNEDGSVNGCGAQSFALIANFEPGDPGPAQTNPVCNIGGAPTGVSTNIFGPFTTACSMCDVTCPVDPVDGDNMFVFSSDPGMCSGTAVIPIATDMGCSGVATAESPFQDLPAPGGNLPIGTLVPMAFTTAPPAANPTDPVTLTLEVTGDFGLCAGESYDFQSGGVSLSAMAGITPPAFNCNGTAFTNAGGDCSIATFVYTMDFTTCLLYTSPSPRDRTRSRMPSSA